jgi:hypothetical protein
VIAALVLAATAPPAFADDLTASASRPDTTTETEDDSPRYLLLLGETAGVMIPPTIWYWSNTGLQTEDWDLHWDWDSWEKKLFSVETIRFDTNSFAINAIRHPAGGAIHYQVARANGFGIPASMLIDFTASAFWEYVVEFKELVSLNDLIVNTTVGLGIGEPLFQIGRLRNGQSPGWARRLVAFLVSPFEGVHQLTSVRTYANEPLSWDRLRLTLGAGTARFGDRDRSEGWIGLDVEVVGHPGYGQPGSSSGGVRAGQWSRLAFDLRLGGDPDEHRRPLTRIRARTTLGGRYRRSIDASGNGSGLFIGPASAFEYQTRRLAEEWDRLALFHIIGPFLESVTYRDDLTIRWDTGLYGDFAFVQAHVFGPMPDFLDPINLTSVLRAHGYYYGVGSSLETRLGVEGRRWDAEAELAARQYWSIDARDRVEMGGGDLDPHGVTDQRVALRLRAGVEMIPGVRLDAVGEGIVRRGAWKDQTRRTEELGAGLRLSVGF